MWFYSKSPELYLVLCVGVVLTLILTATVPVHYYDTWWNKNERTALNFFFHLLQFFLQSLYVATVSQKHS